MATLLDSDQIDRHLAVLEQSQDSDQVVASAIALAASANPAALVVLGRFLVSPEFLARLDVLADPQRKLTNLRHVLTALEANPTEVTGRLCEGLARDPSFLADPDRKMFLLTALAAVCPMTEPAEAIFRAANTEGYFNGNGPLLVANGSSRALALFEEMVADDRVDADTRVDMFHRAVLAHRLESRVLAACRRLLGRGLEPEMEKGIVETLFDYREHEWFGVARVAPRPPPWSEGTTDVLQAYVQLGRELCQRGKLAEPIVAAIERTQCEISDTLATR
jgi:hypothetical protein